MKIPFICSNFSFTDHFKFNKQTKKNKNYADYINVIQAERLKKKKIFLRKIKTKK